MTREHANPLTLCSSYVRLQERIMLVLTNRHPLEAEMPADMLRAAVQEPSEVDFLSAMSELTNDGRVRVEWGTGPNHKRTGFYSANRSRATTNTKETLL